MSNKQQKTRQERKMRKPHMRYVVPFLAPSLCHAHVLCYELRVERNQKHQAGRRVAMMMRNKPSPL
jgi:hypothetical protein